MSTFKRLALYAFCLLLVNVGSATAQPKKSGNNFIVEGVILDMPAPPDRLYVIYDTILHRPNDTVAVRNGKYVLRGHIEEPTRVTVRRDFPDVDGRRSFSSSTNDQVDLFLEKGTVKVVSSGHMSSAVVTGSPAYVDFHQANRRMELWGDTLRSMYKMALETKNDVMARSIFSPQNLNKIETIIVEDYTAFIRNHPASGASLLLVRNLMNGREAAGWVDSVAALYQLLPAGTRSGMQGRLIGERLVIDLKTALGHKAMDFTQNDVQGHPVSLSSFKGKYVLLDFWASWDANASGALSILAKAGEMYAGKGLVILGVSLDADKDSWQQVIRDANAGSTMQVSDLKGRDNAAARLYGITVLPKNLLIDPNGIIVARNLTSQTIDKTLSSIFE